MKTGADLTIERGANVWVWDSIWLPAVVVHSEADCVLVKLQHGVTFPVAADNLDLRDPSRRGSDTPRSPRRPVSGAELPCIKLRAA